MNNNPGWSASHHPHLPTSRAAPDQERGVLAILRSLMPRRLLSGTELELVAELQANRLLELAGLPQFPVPNELITDLPRISVRLDPDLPVSGAAQWLSGRWLISINATEPWQRQRFSLAHELKHVIDHPYVEVAYAGEEAAEHAADLFAAFLLMPRREVKRAWGQGKQRLPDLAAHFGVSEPAIRLRLQTLGLTAPLPRHAPGPRPHQRHSGGTYLRRSNPLFARSWA